MPGMAFNSVKPTIDNYEESMHMLYEEAFITIMVVWFFLRKWRATLISAVALPLSLIPAFGVMSLAGFSLNVISLLALSLVVGILVDDAIVEVENITRHLRMGKKPYKAALEAANEIGLAVIATSLTLVAVFLPTAFMGGQVHSRRVTVCWRTCLPVQQMGIYPAALFCCIYLKTMRNSKRTGLDSELYKLALVLFITRQFLFFYHKLV